VKKAAQAAAGRRFRVPCAARLTDNAGSPPRVFSTHVAVCSRGNPAGIPAGAVANASRFVALRAEMVT